MTGLLFAFDCCVLCGRRLIVSSCVCLGGWILSIFIFCVDGDRILALMKSEILDFFLCSHSFTTSSYIIILSNRIFYVLSEHYGASLENDFFLCFEY